MALETSDSKLIVGLLVVIIIIFIIFIIAAVFFAFLPIYRMEKIVTKTSTDIETTIGVIDETAKGVNNLITTINQEMTNINIDIKAAKDGICNSAFKSYFPFCKS